MYKYRRVFQLKHVGAWNFAFWFGWATIEWAQAFSSLAAAGKPFIWHTIIQWPISFFLICWLLSSAFVEFYFQVRNKPIARQAIFVALLIPIFGFAAKILSEIATILLERLFYKVELFTWSQFYEQFIPTLPFVFYSSGVFLLYFFLLKGLDFYGRFRSQSVYTLDLEQKMIDAQLQTLKMQLKPHFLFNALNTIAMMVRRNSTDAVNMISGLSDLLRSTLTAENRQFVTLKEELQLLEKYLAIESVRYQDRLKIELETDTDSLPCRVPNLLLQPLVENAFKHGVAHSLDESLLRISTQKKVDSVWISIYNSGSALPRDWDVTSLKGIGLLNTVNRLRQLYKGSSRFEISNAKGGVLVTIQLPYQTLK